jgi:hypothetical protein
MILTRWLCAGGLLALFTQQAAFARPITFTNSTTVIADYREGAMAELQVFYVPQHNVSFGIGQVQFEDDSSSVKHSVSYARFNFLARRWNFESAQANIFVWGGVGGAYLGGYTLQPDGSGAPSHDHGGPIPGDRPINVRSSLEVASNAGTQIDFETRRIYLSFKSDYFNSRLFWHRADTLQFGIAPYEHDANTLATWFVVSGRNYTGDMHKGQELAFLLRLFKKNTWLEAGATTDGKIQAMAMFSF